MPRRTWDAKTTAMIGIQGLKGKPGEAICTAPKLCQAQYDRWRDQFLAHAAQALEGTNRASATPTWRVRLHGSKPWSGN